MRRCVTEQQQPVPEPRWSRAVVAGAARRFGKLILGFASVTVAASLAIGLPSGSSLSRSLSTGFYAVGCATLLIGFALAARGPVRAGKGDGRGFRWITPSEREEAVADSAIFIALAVVLLMIGVLCDTRYPLV
jgi:hypothetical protein